MKTLCPYCESPIDLPEFNHDDQQQCPSCGSNFSVVEGLTIREERTDHGQIGHFKLINTIGAGGFGTVWAAQDLKLDRTVAIKLPRKGQLSERETDSFLREASIAAQLRHRHIVSIHEVGRDGDTPYIVSDYIQGVTLSDWLSDDRRGYRESAELCIKIASRALDHAHDSGIIHRDLKPSNIILDNDGEPHLLDFGLAKRGVGEVTVTSDGDILGTPAFMSPEQASGQSHEADSRSDIYSLGVILFKCLTGELPFRGTPRLLVHQVINSEPRPPSSLNDQVPKDLETICMKAMAKEPKRRYDSAAAMADDLSRWLDGRPILARPISPIGKLTRWALRNRGIASLAAALALAICVGFGGVAFQWRQAEFERSRAIDAEAEARAVAVGEREARIAADSARSVAEQERMRAEQEKARAERERARAEQERTRAERNFEIARQTVDDYFTGVSESKLLNQQGLQAFRQELLQKALSYYKTFSEQRANDQTVLGELAAAHLRMAQIQTVIGATDDALNDLDQALDIIEGMFEQGNDIDANRFPSWFSGTFRAPRYDRRDSAVPSNPIQAILLLKRACDVWEKLLASAPDTPGFQVDLAGCCYYYGTVQLLIDNQRVAIKYLHRACDLLHGLTSDYPDNALYRGEYSIIVADTAAALRILDRYEEAVKYCEQALESCPDEEPILTALARALATKSDEDSETYRRACDIAERAVDIAPNEAEAWNTLGMVKYRSGLLDEAISALNTSVRLRGEGDPWDWYFLAMAEHQRGNRDVGREWYEKAVSWTAAQNARTQFRIRLISDEAAGMLESKDPK